MVFSFVPDENVRATRLRSGELDVDAVGLPPRVADDVATTDGIELVRIPGESTLLLLPENNPIFADPAVRRAIGLAVDRQPIAEGVFAGAARPSMTPVAARHWAFADLPIPQRDVAEAGRLLDQAGWTAGPDGARQRGGQPLAFPLVYGAGSAVANNTALTLRDQLAHVGMRVDLEGLGFEAQTERLAEGTAMLNTQASAYDPELDFYRTYHSSFAVDDEAFTNGTRMSSPAVDAALATGRSSPDRSVRAPAYVELQRALVEEGSYLYLVQGENSLIVRDRVQGVAPQVREGHIHGFSRGLLWNLHQWRLAAP